MFDWWVFFVDAWKSTITDPFSQSLAHIFAFWNIRFSHSCSIDYFVRSSVRISIFPSTNNSLLGTLIFVCFSKGIISFNIRLNSLNKFILFILCQDKLLACPDNSNLVSVCSPVAKPPRQLRWQSKDWNRRRKYETMKIRNKEKAKKTKLWLSISYFFSNS